MGGPNLPAPEGLLIRRRPGREGHITMRAATARVPARTQASADRIRGPAAEAGAIAREGSAAAATVQEAEAAQPGTHRRDRATASNEQIELLNLRGAGLTQAPLIVSGSAGETTSWIYENTDVAFPSNQSGASCRKDICREIKVACRQVSTGAA